MPVSPEPAFVIAGDYPTTRKTVRDILEGNGFRVVGEAANGDEVVRACRDLRPDIAVLDVSLPLPNGLDGARLVKRNHPHIKVIVLTVYAAGPHLLESLAIGVSAYITKSKAATCLVHAIDAVREGDLYVRVASSDYLATTVPSSPENLQDLIVKAQKALQARNGAKASMMLTRRQQEVLSGVLRMRANKEIACELNVTERTVKFHVGSLLAKFNVHSRMDLIRRASLRP